MDTAKPGNHHDGEPGCRQPGRSAAATRGTPRGRGQAGIVELRHVSGKGTRGTVPAAMCLSLFKQFPVPPSPLDETLHQRQHLGDPGFNKYGTSGGKDLPQRRRATRQCSHIFFDAWVRMLSCRTACSTLPIRVDGIRVDRGENFGGRCGPSRSAIRNADDCLSPESFFRSYRPGSGPSSRFVTEPLPRASTRPRVASAGMSLRAIGREIDYAYGDFRWGFTWGITLGIRLGILLERHPLRRAKTPVSGPTGGSAGIPDSLAHKPVNTSGRAYGRARSLRSLAVAPCQSVFLTASLLSQVLSCTDSLPPVAVCVHFALQVRGIYARS